MTKTPGCPPGPIPDADFGVAPRMLSIQVKGMKKDIIAAVQKSGFRWALDRDNGSLLWSTSKNENKPDLYAIGKTDLRKQPLSEKHNKAASSTKS
ncbi:hypothetical protein Dsin_007484 [Dipteronia sinensis]|uniref:Pyrrolo-quinoline quinone repeat domain-containing protein n=1 Tax=Dipteronia sinensis TaxID=43782 RepID=A0AAE0B1I3_9ROSI|nr:hypothetical protein Dsin_007484 [Dipteronia sinensis]